VRLLGPHLQKVRERVLAKNEKPLGGNGHLTLEALGTLERNRIKNPLAMAVLL
jgi:hypothetical protein